MAISHDTTTTLASGTGTRSWSHTAAASLVGGATVVVSGGAVDETTGVTYGGTAMTRIATGRNTSGETGTTSVWHLASHEAGWPGNGTQTVQVSRSASTAYIAACTTELVASGKSAQVVPGGLNVGYDEGNSLSISTITTSLTIPNGLQVLMVGGLYSGENALSSITDGADLTRTHSVDFGNFVSVLNRRTSIYTGTGSAYTGFAWTQSSDDGAWAVVAIQEYTPPVNVNAALGNLASTASLASGAGRKGGKAALGALSGASSLAGAGRKGAKASAGTAAEFAADWYWPSSVEGWALTQVQGGSVSFAWHASGQVYLQGPVLVGEDQDQVGYIGLSGTWASLFGASGDVTQVRLDAISTQFTNVGNNIGTITIGPVAIYSGGTLVAQLWSGRTVPQGTNEGSPTTTPQQSAVAVGASYQAAGTSIQVRVGYTTGYDQFDDQSFQVYVDSLGITALGTAAGSLDNQAAYTMAATGEKGQGLDRFAALGNLASGTSQAGAGRKGATAALGTIQAVPGFSLAGRKAVSRALGTVSSGTTQALAGRKAVSRAAGTITATTSMAATGVKAGPNVQAALGNLAVSTSMAATGRKGAARALGSLAVTTSQASGATTAKRQAAGAITSTAAAAGGAGRKAVSRAAGNLSSTGNLALAGRKGAKAALAHQVTTTQALAASGQHRAALGTIQVATSQAMTGTSGTSMNRYAALGDLNVTATLASGAGWKGVTKALGTVTGSAALASGAGRKGARAALAAAFGSSLAAQGRKGARATATMALGASLAAQGRTSRYGVAHQAAGYALAVLGVPGRAGAAGDLAVAYALAAVGAANQRALVGDEVAGVHQDAYGAALAGDGILGSLGTGTTATTRQDAYGATITEGSP